MCLNIFDETGLSKLEIEYITFMCSLDSNIELSLANTDNIIC